MEPFHYFPGTIPVIISIPHAGVHVPATIAKRLTQPALRYPDTDWHLQQLYAFARETGVHLLIATHSRYVIDLNRGLDDLSLYPGQFTTSLCPLTLFDGSPLYQQGMEPAATEIAARIDKYWRPYHQQLQTLIDTLNDYQRLIVFDAHSIRSQVPLLFDGVLPSLNFGTADGTSASNELLNKLMGRAEHSPYSRVSNGRFKGGYITRHYGNPTRGLEAIQLELAQLNYMQEIYPFTYDHHKASKLQAVLRDFLAIMVAHVQSG